MTGRDYIIMAAVFTFGLLLACAAIVIMALGG